MDLARAVSQMKGDMVWSKTRFSYPRVLYLRRLPLAQELFNAVCCRKTRTMTCQKKQCQQCTDRRTETFMIWLTWTLTCFSSWLTQQADIDVVTVRSCANLCAILLLMLAPTGIV